MSHEAFACFLGQCLQDDILQQAKLDFFVDNKNLTMIISTKPKIKAATKQTTIMISII